MPWLAHEFKARLAISPVGPLYDLAPILRAGRLTVRRMPKGIASGHLEGLLFAQSGDRFVVEVEPEPTAWQTEPVLPDKKLRRTIARRRMRFRILHEVAHSFFYDRTGLVPRRIFPTGGRREERFCDQFAAALLLAPDAVAGAGTSEALQEAAARHDVSIELAARTAADFSSVRPAIALGYRVPGTENVRLQWTNDIPLWERLRCSEHTGGARRVGRSQLLAVAV